MELLKKEEFELTVIKDVSKFVDRHCKNKSDFNKKEEVEAKIDIFFGQNPKISRVATEIGLAMKTRKENTELLIRSTMEFAYNNYKVDMERKIEEISSLCRALQAAQQKSRLGIG
jgi:tRNA nucleotidyltransferase/poly(A) polymerase